MGPQQYLPIPLSARLEKPSCRWRYHAKPQPLCQPAPGSSLYRLSSSTHPKTHIGPCFYTKPGVYSLARFVSEREVRGFLAALKSAAGSAKVPKQQVHILVQADAAQHYSVLPGQMPCIMCEPVVRVRSKLTCT